jgi:hypothetical protein
MPELRATILLEVDGVALPDFPIIRRYIVAELSGLNAISQPADNNTSTFHPIPQLTMPSLGVFLLTSDQALNLKLNLNTPVALNANGLMLILGCTLTQGTPSQNVEINNPAASTAANVGVLAGGT